MKKSAPPVEVRTLSCRSYYSLTFIKLNNIFNELKSTPINEKMVLIGGVL